MAKFEIFVDRGNGLKSNWACSNGDNTFSDSDEAWECLEMMAEEYPDVDWVLTQDGIETMRIEKEM